jgi:hypothetical protein
MKAITKKTKQQKQSRAAANRVSQHKSKAQGAPGFEDNRPVIKALTSMQLKIDNSNQIAELHKKRQDKKGVPGKPIQCKFTHKGKEYNENNAGTWKKQIHGVSRKDIIRLAQSDTDFGTLTTKLDFTTAITQMDTAPVLAPQIVGNVNSYSFGDKTQVLIRDTTNNLVVGLDPHQNKHQHPKTMIAQLGIWKSKKGSTFARGKGLAWHTANTAITMQNWAIGQLPLQPNQTITLAKRPMTDGYIYDASIQLDQGIAVVAYHCNPTESE